MTLSLPSRHSKQLEEKRLSGVFSYSGVFWVNDDDDQQSGDAVPVQQIDNQNTAIDCPRDLEDFTRLWIYLKGVHEMVKGSEPMLVGLKWKEVSEGSPAIRLFEAYEQDGGDEYLKDETNATQQIQGQYGQAIEAMFSGNTVVTSAEPFIFPSEIWDELDEEHYKKYFLFEGVSEGKGKLQLVFLNQNQEEIGEAPPIYLEISNIKKMYQRSEGNQFIQPWDERDEAVIFVHGWRMSPEGSTSFAETMYKRLWHRGFKGRFAYFRWDTDWSSSFEWLPYLGEPIDAYLAHYNDSEHNAWLAGQSLKNFVNSIPKSNKNIAAHSMGNIVAGSALLAGMNINNYALMQPAVPAACYDERQEIEQTLQYNHLTFTMWDEDSPDDDPDPVTRALAYRGRLKNVGGNLVLFHLKDDYATFRAWEINNDQAKPPGNLSANFRYQRNNPNGQKLYKYHYENVMMGEVEVQQEVVDYYLSDPYEAMPYACRSWGKAAGAEPDTQGAIDDKVNLSAPVFQLPEEETPGFGDEHSGQFNANIQNLKPFYDELINKLQVGPPNP